LSWTDLPTKAWQTPTSTVPTAVHEEKVNAKELLRTPESGRILLFRKDRLQGAPAWQRASLQPKPVFYRLHAIRLPLKLGGADAEDAAETEESNTNGVQPG